MPMLYSIDSLCLLKLFFSFLSADLWNWVQNQHISVKPAKIINDCSLAHCHLIFKMALVKLLFQNKNKKKNTPSQPCTSFISHLCYCLSFHSWYIVHVLFLSQMHAPCDHKYALYIKITHLLLLYYYYFYQRSLKKQFSSSFCRTLTLISSWQSAYCPFHST